MNDNGMPRVIGPLLNIPQTAEYLGCSVSNIWRMINSGLITYARIGHEGGRIMFDVADLDSYVRARKVPATRKPRRKAIPA